MSRIPIDKPLIFDEDDARFVNGLSRSEFAELPLACKIWT